MGKRQICIQLDEEDAKKMEEIRTTTGIPLSKQIELKLKGYNLTFRKMKLTILLLSQKHMQNYQ